MNRFENVFPRLIDAVVRAGAFFYVSVDDDDDDGIEAWDEIIEALDKIVSDVIR